MVKPGGVFQKRFTWVGDTAEPENPVGALGTVESARIDSVAIGKMLSDKTSEKNNL